MKRSGSKTQDIELRTLNLVETTSLSLGGSILLATLVHELAHILVGLIYGMRLVFNGLNWTLEPYLYPSTLSHQDLTNIYLAGNIANLMFGIIFLVAAFGLLWTEHDKLATFCLVFAFVNLGFFFDSVLTNHEWGSGLPFAND